MREVSLHENVGKEFDETMQQPPSPGKCGFNPVPRTHQLHPVPFPNHRAEWGMVFSFCPWHRSGRTDHIRRFLLWLLSDQLDEEAEEEEEDEGSGSEERQPSGLLAEPCRERGCQSPPPRCLPLAAVISLRRGKAEQRTPRRRSRGTLVWPHAVNPPV